MVAFGFLPQNLGSLRRPITGTMSFYECRLSGGELRGVTETLPAVIKFV